MKISEIISEGREGQRPAAARSSDTGEWRFRDVGGYDRTYHLHRIMMAAAMADGKDAKPVDMDQSSWAEKYNVARPYTEEEHMMMRSALNTVDSEYDESEPDHRSMERPGTNVVSPMTPKGPVKRKGK